MKPVCPKCGSEHIHSSPTMVLKNTAAKFPLTGMSFYIQAKQNRFKKSWRICLDCHHEFPTGFKILPGRRENKKMTNGEWYRVVKEQPVYKVLSEVLLWIFIFAMMFFLYRSLTIFEIK